MCRLNIHSLSLCPQSPTGHGILVALLWKAALTGESRKSSHCFLHHCLLLCPGVAIELSEHVGHHWFHLHSVGLHKAKLTLLKLLLNQVHSKLTSTHISRLLQCVRMLVL